MRYLVHAVFWLMATLGALPALAQLTLDGQVRDARTQQPLAFASVFLANTTYGATTDSTGHFVLAGVPAGQYDLMVSYIGYELYKQTLNVQQATTLAPRLLPTATQLGEVAVRPTKNRPADFRKFLQQFLGSSTLSQQCRIENPQEVVVLYDEARRQLTAVAPHSLHVLNQALGYRITYYNFDFKVFYAAGRCEFVAAPMFEALKTTDARQQQQWEENRRHAYAGSLPHFLRSVRANRLVQEGFLVRALKIEGDTPAAQQHIARAADSLAAVLTPEPGLLGLVYKQPIGAAQLCRPETTPDHLVALRFPWALQVTYQGEQPDAVYVANETLARRNEQVNAEQRRWAGGVKIGTVLAKPAVVAPIQEVSELRFLGPDAIIQPNGYLTNPLSIRLDGYWAFEKIGESLPLDYSPALLK